MKTVLILIAISLVLPAVSRAAEVTCGIGITKQANGAGALKFQFDTQSGSNHGNFELADGESTGGPIPAFTPFVITEESTSGWELADVQCNSGGLQITRIQNGISVLCTNTASGDCTFINIPSNQPIPTLSEWGLISMAGILGIAGFIVIRRKRVVA